MKKFSRCGKVLIIKGLRDLTCFWAGEGVEVPAQKFPITYKKSIQQKHRTIIGTAKIFFLKFFLSLISVNRRVSFLLNKNRANARYILKYRVTKYEFNI